MVDRRKFFLGIFLNAIMLNSPQSVYAQQAVRNNKNGENRHNISSYRYQKWQDHFKSIKNIKIHLGNFQTF